MTASNTPSNSTEQDKLDFKKILPVFVIVLIDLLGLTIIIPLMPLYAASFGADALTIGLLGAAYPVMQFIGAPLLGRLSDQYGRRPILVISQLGTLVGFLVLGFSNTLWLLFLARIIDGISGANIATAQAVITDSTTEKNRTQGLGLLGAAFGIGFVVGPIIAFVSLALSGNNYRVPAFAAAIFSLLSILLTWFWLQETLPPEQRGQATEKAGFSSRTLFQELRHPAVGLLLALMFAQQIAFGGLEQLLALFTLNRLGLNASGNAIIFVFVGLIVVVVQGWLIGRWSRRFGDRRLVYIGLAVLAIGLVFTALTPEQPLPTYSRERLEQELRSSGDFRTHENPTTRNLAVELPPDTNNGWLGISWMLVAMVPAAIGCGMLQPSINSLITKRVNRDEVGGMLGISAAFLSGANAIAPLIGGVIFQALGASAPFLLGGMLMAVLWLIAVLALKPGREESQPAGLARSAGGH
ncbi:MAG: MFS transporter [Anaerolineales bacterium]|nr:MAG: MFS transporter [Anaerolineales bacterium]